MASKTNKLFSNIATTLDSIGKVIDVFEEESSDNNLIKYYINENKIEITSDILKFKKCVINNEHNVLQISGITDILKGDLDEDDISITLNIKYLININIPENKEIDKVEKLKKLIIIHLK